jgi:hypothetical protein
MSSYLFVIDLSFESRVIIIQKKMQAIKPEAPVDVPLTRASQGYLIRCLLLTHRSCALNIHSQPETRNPLPQISSLPVQYSIYPKILFPISTIMMFKPVLYRPDHPISVQICSQLVVLIILQCPFQFVKCFSLFRKVVR